LKNIAIPREALAAGKVPGLEQQRTHLKLLTTIVATADEWSVARFELLASALQLRSGDGSLLFAVAAREREPLEAGAPVLLTVLPEEFDDMWSVAVGKRTAKEPEERGAGFGSHGVPIDWPRQISITEALEASPGRGRFIADCSLDCLTDLTSDRLVVSGSLMGHQAAGARSPDGGALASVHVYVRNVAIWLALLETDERDGPVVKLRF
jgi:hypothetical protein